MFLYKINRAQINELSQIFDIFGLVAHEVRKNVFKPKLGNISELCDISFYMSRIYETIMTIDLSENTSIDKGFLSSIQDIRADMGFFRYSVLYLNIEKRPELVKLIEEIIERLNVFVDDIIQQLAITDSDINRLKLDIINAANELLFSINICKYTKNEKHDTETEKVLDMDIDRMETITLRFTAAVSEFNPYKYVWLDDDLRLYLHRYYRFYKWYKGVIDKDKVDRILSDYKKLKPLVVGLTKIGARERYNQKKKQEE